MKLIKLIIGVLIIAAFPLKGISQVKKQVDKSKTPVGEKLVMKNLLDSFSYAEGLNIAGSMQHQGITQVNSSLMQKAIDDIFNNRTPLLTAEQANAKLQEQLQVFAAAKKAKEMDIFTSNKSRKEITSLPNGLQYEILKAGDPAGIKPGPSDTVVVDYVGTLIDGSEFDNSVKRGQPATFPVGGVIRGWTEILQLMKKGAKWKVYIPSELGYGERGSPPMIKPGATLIFEINLIDIKTSVKQ